VISFKVDKTVKTALQKLAEEENRSLSNYISTLLLDHLKSKGVDWRRTRKQPKK
jgi:hypothetical protein